jgi:hypothetical protein
MTDTITTTTPDIPDDIRVACAIARGEIEGPQEPIGWEVATERAAGRVMRRVRWIAAEGRWEPVTPHRLTDGGGDDAILAPVYAGDLIAVYYEGRPVSKEVELYCAADPVYEYSPRYVACPIAFRRDKRLGIRLPDGSEILAPDPTR